MEESCRNARLHFILIVFGLAATLADTGHYTNSTYLEEIWNNPCTGTPLMRHGRSTLEETQLRRFTRQLGQVFLRNLLALYPKVNPRSIPKRGQCLRVNKMLESITKQENHTKMAVKEFYRHAFTAMACLDQLQNTPFRTVHIFDNKKRIRIFEEVKVHLRLVMCEFHDGNKGVSFGPVPKADVSKCFPKVLNRTNAPRADIQLMTRLRQFFVKSKNALRKIKRNERSRRRNRKGGKKSN